MKKYQAGSIIYEIHVKIKFNQFVLKIQISIKIIFKNFLQSFL